MVSEVKNNVLDVSGLSIGYTEKGVARPVANGINFSLSKGELIGLVGVNGVGKSTLLRTLAGMQSPLGGSISYSGKSLKDYTSLELAQQLSVVLTEPPASKNLSVLELISLGRQPHTNWMGNLSPKDKEAVNKALKITETDSLKDRKCYELSDGQLQRVVIARALAQDPPIIILDEPTTHLDLYHRAYILKLLKKLASEEQKAILFSTHEIDLAIQLADKMIVMTPKTIYFDSPCKLIAAGNFDTLFPEDTIHFDKLSGRFNIKG